MKLSVKDIKIIAACETEADLTVAAIATRVSSPQHVVHRVLRLMQSRGVINRRAYMNSFLLGTAPYLIGFTFNARGRQHRKRFHEYLRNCQEVSYVAMVGGHFNILTEVRFKSVHQIELFLDKLSVRFGRIFSEKEVLTLTAMHDFPVLAAPAERNKLREFATAVTDKVVKLDEVDKQILTGLSKNWDDSTVKLAQRLKLPSSTVDYHIKRLRKEGIVVGSRYFIDLFKLNFHTFYHFVSTNDFHPDIRKRLLSFARKQQHVHCFRTFIGAWDFIFECHYEDISESIEFVERLADFGADDISKIETVPVLSFEKVSDCTV